MNEDNDQDKPHGVNHADLAEMVGSLEGILNFLRSWGRSFVVIIATAVWFLVVDHFTLTRTVDDTEWMKPRVTSLWYKAHPDGVNESVSAGETVRSQKENP